MTRDVLLVAAAFAACAVEMVEALTIVLAVGVTRGWRSALAGAGTALVALALCIAVLGPALARLPIDSLRLVVGSLLLVFGLQWLRKAILRASGLRSMHDETEVYAREVAALREHGAAAHDWYAFTVACKGVLLEGLEVAFIVVTFGGSQHHVGLAAIGAAAAACIVLVAGVIVHEPLSRVPENTLKFGVGIMLSGFGVFWAGEGAGVDWPGHDLAIFAVIAWLLVTSFALIAVARRSAAGARLEGAGA